MGNHSATPDYLPSCKASLPIGWYQILLGTCTCVNLPGVLDIRAAGIQTRDLLIVSPAHYRYATVPHTGGQDWQCVEMTVCTPVTVCTYVYCTPVCRYVPLLARLRYRNTD